MRLLTAQSERPMLSERLRERLASLRLTMAVFDRAQGCQLLGTPRPLEQLIVASRPFCAAVQAALATLTSHAGEAVELWSGLWLVPLPTERRRRAGQHDRAEPLVAAMLITPELLQSEQLHRVCDDRSVDYQAIVRSVDQAELTDRSQVQRIAAMIGWMRQDAIEIDRRFGELHTMSQELAESYEELSLLYKFSTNMTVNQPPQEFLTDACRELQQVVGLKWMALQLIDDEPRLNELAGEIYVAGPIVNEQVMLRDIGRQLIEHQPNAHNALVVEDTATLDIPALPGIARNLLVVPLSTEGRPLGILFGGDKLDGSHISSIDSKLCSSLANSLSIFLENVMLYEDMQAMFMGTLHALTASIDAKDSYTHGHSERVALMSRQLAQAAGLDEHTIERVYIAGLVHDVGKIGVPESVLCKPGPLTDEEFALIKMHPEIGGRILQDIRQMEDLVPGVLYHHERWDGRGYPHGKQGEEIPLLGRLIGLADAFDAMSSNRSYRQSLALRDVLAEVRRCAGTQFDPQLAQVFVNLDFKPFFEMIRRHQNHSVGGQQPLMHGRGGQS